jgi:hyperosmotically inducible protein
MDTLARLQRMAAIVVFGGAAVGLAGLTACNQDTRRADADNTARNVADRDGTAPTPLDQGGSEGDRAITQHIRQAVTGNDSLSMNAHNVKIITQDGVVTLRGPVETEAEKSVVVAAAQSTPGVQRVDDRLEVKAAD